MPVNTPLKDYEDMQKSWELPLTLMGGTPAIREAGKKYLPQQPKESNEAYQARLAQSYLVNMYKKTVQSLVGQSFLRSVVVTNVPSELEYLENNIDGAHTTITDFAANLFRDALIFGKEHSYTDFPQVNPSAMSLPEFKQLRAYASRIDPRNVIGWRVDTSNGYEELTEVRIQETETYIDDDWVEHDVERIRVIRKDEVELWELDDSDEGSGEFELIATAPNTLGYIPLNVTYADKLAFFKSKSPLEDLAYLNLRHYQSMSDQIHILHIARVPFIFASGIVDNMEGLEIGTNRLVTASEPDAKMGYVEHTGNAIGAGRTDLKDLLEQMGMLGADLVMSGVSRPDRQTAAASLLDHSQSLSLVQIILRGIEESLKNIYKVAGDYMNVAGADQVSITINDEAGIPSDPNPTQSVIALLEALNLSEEEILRELKRRGLVSSSLQKVSLAPKEVATPSPQDAEEGNNTEDKSDEDEDSDESQAS